MKNPETTEEAKTS